MLFLISFPLMPNELEQGSAVALDDGLATVWVATTRALPSSVIKPAVKRNLSLHLSYNITFLIFLSRSFKNDSTSGAIRPFSLL